MDGKKPRTSIGGPSAQSLQDDIEASQLQAANDSIRDMVYEYDQTWEAERTGPGYAGYMHATMNHELDLRLVRELDNEEHVQHIERQRRIVNDGNYRLPDNMQNFGQMVRADPSLRTFVMGSLEVMDFDGRTVNDLEVSESLPVPTDPFYHAVLEGTQSDYETAIREAQDEEQRNKRIAETLTYLGIEWH